MTQLGYSKQQAADACGLSLDTINKAIKSGRLRAKRTSVDERGNPSGKYVITPDAIREWIDSMEDA